MRRSFFVRGASLGWLCQLLQPAFEPRDLFTASLQFSMQADQDLVHLFEVVLQV